VLGNKSQGAPEVCQTTQESARNIFKTDEMNFMVLSFICIGAVMGFLMRPRRHVVSHVCTFRHDKTPKPMKTSPTP
jgi:hypothetical protein